MLSKRLFLAAAVASLVASPAVATTVSDPAGDFLGSFTGTQNGDLDILSASASISGANLLLSVTVNGTIGTTPNALYSFLIDRGGGTGRLNLLFNDVTLSNNPDFDAVAVLFPNGSALNVVIPSGGPPQATFLPGAVTVSGDTLSALFPLANFPTNGVDPASYTFSLLSRQRVVPGMDSGNAEIADFAPDAVTFTASVPEPASWMTMILGFGALGAAARSRRRTAAAASTATG